MASLPTDRDKAQEGGPIEGEVPVGGEPGQAPGPALSLRELGEVLVRHYGLTEGMFEIVVTFQLGVGSFGPDAQNLLPSGLVGVQKVGLRRLPADREFGPGFVDAAAIAGQKPAAKKPRRPALRRTA